MGLNETGSSLVYIVVNRFFHVQHTRVAASHAIHVVSWVGNSMACEAATERGAKHTRLAC